MILVQNCRMIDPASQTDGLRDILIGEDRITKIAEAGTIDPAQITKEKEDELRILNADGLIAAPGLVDTHVHFRDPGAEYKEDIKKRLTEKKETEAKNAKETAALEKAVENAQMDIPAAMIDNQVRQMADDFARRIQSQGISLEQYLQFTGMTADKLLDQMRPEAEKRIKNSLVLEAIAKAESFEISDEKVEEEINKMAETYKMEADKVKELLGEAGVAQMKNDLGIQEAVNFLRDSAVEV